MSKVGWNVARIFSLERCYSARIVLILKMLKNEYSVAKISVDTAANEPRQVVKLNVSPILFQLSLYSLQRLLSPAAETNGEMKCTNSQISSSCVPNTYYLWIFSFIQPRTSLSFTLPPRRPEWHAEMNQRNVALQSDPAALHLLAQLLDVKINDERRFEIPKTGFGNWKCSKCDFHSWIWTFWFTGPGLDLPFQVQTSTCRYVKVRPRAPPVVLASARFGQDWILKFSLNWIEYWTFSSILQTQVSKISANFADF